MQLMRNYFCERKEMYEKLWRREAEHRIWWKKQNEGGGGGKKVVERNEYERDVEVIMDWESWRKGKRMWIYELWKLEN